MARTSVPVCSDCPAGIQSILDVFAIDDRQERLDGIRERLLPYLEGLLTRFKRDMSGFHSRSIPSLSEAVKRPRWRQASATEDALAWAQVVLVPKRRQRAAYAVPGSGRKPTKGLPLSLGVFADGSEVRTQLWVGAGAVPLLAALWKQHRAVVLALMEASGAELGSDPVTAGPPSIALADQIDAILASGPKRIDIFSLRTSGSWSTASVSEVCQMTFRTIYPLFVGMIELALGREPSLPDFTAWLAGWYYGGEKPTDGRISTKLRYDVLERDDHRCVSCGSKPRDGELEVDHIVPVAAGGTDEIGNLQTLCHRCNRGKGARHVPAATEDEE